MDTSLSCHNKNSINPIIFKKTLQHKISSFCPELVLYTDGSFHNGVTSYSVVEEKSPTQFETISEVRIPNDSGVFSAELAAIKTAIIYAIQSGFKTLICTDSLSAIKAIAKNHNGIYNNIITLPERNKEISILWVPSHIGIVGNECADRAAKNALNLPNITETPCFPKVISSQFRAIQKNLHPFHPRPKYNINLTRRECILLGRLRVGKTLFNTQHYFNHTDPLKCTTCDVILSVAHIFTECPVSKIDDCLNTIIDCTTTVNLPAIRRSLNKHNIQDV